MHDGGLAADEGAPGVPPPPRGGFDVGAAAAAVAAAAAQPLAPTIGSAWSVPATPPAADASSQETADPSGAAPSDTDAAYASDPLAGYALDPGTGYPIDPASGYPFDPNSGYFVDPASGYFIDPNTGYLLDPSTGYPIDPDTGQPFDPSPEAPLPDAAPVESEAAHAAAPPDASGGDAAAAAEEATAPFALDVSPPADLEEPLLPADGAEPFGTGGLPPESASPVVGQASPAEPAEAWGALPAAWASAPLDDVPRMDVAVDVPPLDLSVAALPVAAAPVEVAPVGAPPVAGAAFPATFDDIGSTSMWDLGGASAPTSGVAAALLEAGPGPEDAARVDDLALESGGSFAAADDARAAVTAGQEPAAAEFPAFDLEADAGPSLVLAPASDLGPALDGDGARPADAASTEAGGARCAEEIAVPAADNGIDLSAFDAAPEPAPTEPEAWAPTEVAERAPEAPLEAALSEPEILDVLEEDILEVGADVVAVDEVEVAEAEVAALEVEPTSQAESAIGLETALAADVAPACVAPPEPVLTEGASVAEVPIVPEEAAADYSAVVEQPAVEAPAVVEDPVVEDEVIVLDEPVAAEDRLAGPLPTAPPAAELRDAPARAAAAPAEASPAPEDLPPSPSGRPFDPFADLAAAGLADSLAATAPAPEPEAPAAAIPAPEPIPEPAPDPAAFVSGRHRVVVHTADGQVKRGAMMDAALDGSDVLIEQAAGAQEAIPSNRIKAIFFMLPTGETPLQPQGRRVRVTFRDGRQVAGFSLDYDPTRVGFFMVPADTRTHTARIWVYQSAVRQVAVS